jgi:hypothetical protein
MTWFLRIISEGLLHVVYFHIQAVIITYGLGQLNENVITVHFFNVCCSDLM